jgi:hypothetical protein
MLGILSLAAGAGCMMLAHSLFSGAHFLVADWVGDQREMQDGAVSPGYWREVLGYFPFYLPAIIAVLTGLVFAGLGGGLLWRVSRRGAPTAATSRKPQE